MALESRPGSPASISLGGNYAQPGSSSGSIPEGTALMRECWTGDRNTGAPNYSPTDPQFFYELLFDGSKASEAPYRGSDYGTSPLSADSVRRFLDQKPAY